MLIGGRKGRQQEELKERVGQEIKERAVEQMEVEEGYSKKKMSKFFGEDAVLGFFFPSFKVSFSSPHLFFFLVADEDLIEDGLSKTKMRKFFGENGLFCSFFGGDNF